VKALAFLEERQQQSNLCCSGVLLGRDHHTTLLKRSLPLSLAAQLSGLASLLCSDSYPGSEVVKEVIALCLPCGIPIAACFDSSPGVLCLLAFYHRDSRVLQKAKEHVPTTFVLDDNTA